VLTIIGSFGALFNGLSRIFWSTLLDFYSFNKVYRTLLVIQIAMITLVQWSVGSPWAYFVVVSLSMMCEGAITSILPTEALKHFGTERGHGIYSYLFSSFGVAAITGSLLVLWLQYEIGYSGMLLICLALTMVAFLLTFVYKSQEPFDYLKMVNKGV
jgi:MFS transporter, OFA family, oxalate/formate antiporter